MMTEKIEEERIVITRMVLLYIFLFLLLRFFLHATPSHYLQAPFFLVQFDPAYWLYKFSFLSAINSDYTTAVIFDICLFTTCVLAILFPLKRFLIICFSILLLIYAISYNITIVHHAHPLSITILITLPFWAKRSTNWKLLWEGMRYYVCFAYTASFIWKTLLGTSFFAWNNGVASAKYNLVENIYHNPDSFSSGVMRYFISHPVLLNTGHAIIVLLEGLMVIGFFTKKFDKYLLWFPVIIHLATYFFSDVFFIEMIVCVFVFLNSAQISLIKSRLPLLAKV